MQTGEGNCIMFIWGHLPRKFVNPLPNVSVKAADLLKSSYTSSFFCVGKMVNHTI